VALIHLSGERQRRTIERVPGRDAVDHECDAAPGAAANLTPHELMASNAAVSLDQ